MKKKIIILAILLLNSSSVYAKESFSDVKNHWAEKYISYLIDNNYIVGYSDNSFKPDNTISKAEVCAVVNRIFDLRETEDISFTDVNSSNWYYRDVQIASKYKYIDTTSNSFSNSSVKRVELMQIINKLYNFKDDSKDYMYFNDLNSFNQEEKNTVGALLKDGIITGYDDYKFKGDNEVSRSEFSKIITMCIEKYGRDINLKPVVENTDASEIINSSTDNLSELKDKLKNLIEESRQINLMQYTKDSASNMTLQLFKGDAALNSNVKSEIEEAISNIEAAKKDLVFQVGSPKLTVIGRDESGSEIPVNIFINEEPFKNSSEIKPGRYLMKVTSAEKSDTETHITVENEDKVIELTLKKADTETLHLNLSSGLESLSGYSFKKNERVTVRVLVPNGMEIDKFLVNSVAKNVIDDEFRFIITEDTHIEVSFNNL
ncbi:S-layer homology domain-containing protein [Anaerosphaera aminiphila DSM 21120]|uniref:S-layer homology domain-containing protein n=1 Tax=Anaerosphaera aminiphila DSM 21120 TaxID=1120995 RepID=A0A1M5TKL0_9FIRM|nr:S-layer homology domain-containing protein [Anaerosphaera aminiphila]SHH51312.1 S-layer homology domain-containing protein [Anaerosphaera aminiphila DSM 21120]